MEHYRLWGRILSHHRIVKNETVEIHDGDIESAFLELCRRFDVQRPLQLPKHNREWENSAARSILRSISPSPSALISWKLSCSPPTAKRSTAARAPR